jgi:hypothetical protein
VVSAGAGQGLLYYAFQARGWVGQEVEPGKVAVVCPWDGSHTKGERFDSSTVLFLPQGDDTVGWLHCSHAYCQGRDLQDVLSSFTPAELDQARAAAGITVHDRHRTPEKGLLHGWNARIQARRAVVLGR